MESGVGSTTATEAASPSGGTVAHAAAMVAIRRPLAYRLMEGQVDLDAIRTGEAVER